MKKLVGIALSIVLFIGIAVPVFAAHPQHRIVSRQENEVRLELVTPFGWAKVVITDMYITEETAIRKAEFTYVKNRGDEIYFIITEYPSGLVSIEGINPKTDITLEEILKNDTKVLKIEMELRVAAETTLIYYINFLSLVRNPTIILPPETEGIKGRIKNMSLQSGWMRKGDKFTVHVGIITNRNVVSVDRVD